MRVIFCSLVLIACLFACQDKKPVDQQAEVADTMVTDTMVVEHDNEADPPKSADGLFDDFIYSFMRNRRFQMDRITFPLPNEVDGKNKPIKREDWTFDPLYVKQDVYTLIFDSEKSVKAEKDTARKQVIVEWVYLNKKRVKQYHFNKIDGIWRMTKLEIHAMTKNDNNDFYVFYDRFSTDADYQSAHILNPFVFNTYDFDTFQTIEGLLDVSQWPDYKPTLPKHVITNINYGQNYANSRKRVLLLCSPSGGMGCSLTFVKKGRTWMLERLDN